MKNVVTGHDKKNIKKYEFVGDPNVFAGIVIKMVWTKAVY
jgi:hypothetical protein